MAEAVTPSEAIRLGLCPSCGGSGRVWGVVPVEGERDCSTCGGRGTLAAMLECEVLYCAEEADSYLEVQGVAAGVVCARHAEIIAADPTGWGRTMVIGERPWISRE